MLALDGIRVLDLTTAIAGPYCGQLFGDLGADVIKVEHPGRALSDRAALTPPDWQGPPFSPYWLSTNRNKRSLTLNLKVEEGKAVLADLVALSDVVLENFGARARANLIDERWAWKLNPRVVWGSISFCGRTGPDAELDGYDILAQARSGIMSVTGTAESGPTKAGNSIADYLAGTHLAVGVLAALRQRETTGEGQLVDISLLECAVACLDGFPLWSSIAGITPPRSGNAHPVHFGYGLLECEDDFVAVSINVNRLQNVVRDVLGETNRPPITDTSDPGFRAAADEVMQALKRWARGVKVGEACRVLAAARVPHAPVQNMKDLFEDRQLEARGMFVDHRLDDLGAVRSVASPLHMSASPREVRRQPPGAGEHNDDVLTGLLGYDGDRVAGLVEDGALWGWEA